MSVEGVALGWRTRDEPREPRRKHPLLEFYERLSPSQGWATFAFLMATLLIVGDSVTSASWAETPGIYGVLFLAALAGLALSKVRLPAVLLHPLGLIAGFIVVVWQASYIVEGESIAEQLPQMWERLTLWYTAATTDGISTDLLPLSLVMLTTAWLLGYVGSWFIFRSSNVWPAVVLGGIAMLTNLSFLPDKFASRFFLFTFFAMLLVVRVSIIQRHEIWRKTRTEYSLVGGWLTMNAIVWFSIVVLLLAAFLPMTVLVSKPLATIWKAGRAPIENMEDDFSRLFSGIPSRKNISGRFFGTSLPFLGKISFGGEVVFWADSSYPSYWLSQTYSEYTSKGWKAGETTSIEVGPDKAPPPRGDSLKREAVDQNLQLSFDTTNFLAGGSLDWVSRDAVADTLAPKEFEVDLRNAATDAALPKDIQKLAVELRKELNPPPEEFVESYISRILPEDLVLNEVVVGADANSRRELRKVVVARKEPVIPEIVAWEFSDELEANHIYAMTSFVSLATDDELRSAGTDYNSFITDHYLQLPATLPARVREKSAELTKNAPTPLDKALAIQSYLRGSDFTYSQDIDAPPPNADGVDYFMFETREGYSDYFGSSMAVMLRSVGVPARMAAGYAPGEYVAEQERRVVRDSDSHGWVQVYFPKYGWIDFEPTPKWPAHERKLLAGLGSDELADRIGGAFSEDDIDQFSSLDEDDFGDRVFPDLSQLARPRIDPVVLLTRSAIAMGVLAALWLIIFGVWSLGLIRATPVERAYAKMTRLGALAGMRRRPHQTPIEYASALGNTLPATAAAAQSIAQAFALDRYGAQHDADADAAELDKAWKSIRLSMLGRALRRLIPFGGAQRR